MKKLFLLAIACCLSYTSILADEAPVNVSLEYRTTLDQQTGRYFDYPNVEEVVKAVHEANGYVVLAHPCNYYKNNTKEEVLEKLEKFKSIGIDGVECYYPANSEMMTETCVEFCKNNDMIITVGSDSHGEFGAVSKGIEYYIGAVKKDSSELNLKDMI